MLHFLTSSIRRKLWAAILLAVLAATALSSVLAAWRETERRFETKREAVTAIAAALASTSASGVIAGDRMAIARSLNAISSIPSITYAVVADQSGRRLHEVGNGVVLGSPNAPLAPDQILSLWTTVYLGTYLTTAPIVSNGAQIGSLSLIVDVSDLRTALFDSLLGAVAAGVIATLIGLVVSTRLQRGIAGPVQALRRAATHVQRTADYTQVVPRESNDETGDLVDAFNAMISEIRDRDAALTRQRDRLADDVRERTQQLALAKTAAEDANAAKSQFLAVMSHEIRTPMNGMLVTTELLASEDLSPRARRYCDTILKSSQLLLGIINDILDLSKIEAGQLQLERIDVRPADIAEDVVRLFGDRAADKGLELACYVAPDVPPTITGDPLRLTQVLSNLVSNALKFTKSGGVLIEIAVIDGLDEAPRLRFGVTDTGIGIPAASIPKLFEAFTQAEASTTRRYGGTGIGLTICKRLVDAAGGLLTVESTVGKGSTFAFSLPLEASSVRSPRQDRAGIARPVLLDMPDGPVRTALTRIIADVGAHVIADAAAGGADMITICDSAVAVLPSGARGDRPVSIVAERVRLAPAVHALFDGRDDILFLPAPIGGQMTRAAIAQALLKTEAVPSTWTSAPAQPKPAHSTNFNGVRVLAADDDPVNREVLTETLQRLGAVVTTARNGREAVSIFSEGSFDIVFMDGSMPELDGFEAARAIRAREHATGTARTPVVALTAHALGPMAEQWRAADMDDRIVKPFTLASIRNALEKWAKADAGRALPPTAAKTQSSASADTRNEDTGDGLLIDRAHLEDLASLQPPGGDLVQRVVKIYLTQGPLQLDAIKASVDRNDDAVRVADAVHALKSLSRNIGAVAVGDLCEALEALARDGALPTADALDRLTDLLDKTTAALSGLGVDAQSVECGVAV